jgi:hypothetical protein
VKPNQNIKIIKPPYIKISLELRSKGIFLKTFKERPNKTLTQLRKKKVGPNK